jgi:PD-(D/E)XK nuclease superfamily
MHQKWEHAMESSAVARYQRFFGVYQQVKQGAADAYRSQIAQFMGKVAPLVQRQKEVRKQTAAQFNLFEALGIARNEQYQSRFLAFFLNPTESHDQGGLFLRTFLEHIQLTEIPLQPLDRTVVKLESVIAPYGRVDIVITLPDRRIILIENKVDAIEGDKQIARYQAWLTSKPQPTHGQHLLVFLTPEGRAPQIVDPADVLCVSYRQLGDWVSSLLPELPERLRTVLTHYSENCRVIGGNRRYSMDGKLHAFLTEPSNLDTALEVAEAVETIRREVFKQFWGRVKAQLRAKLQHDGYQRQWEVYSDDDIFAARYPYCGIYWRASDSQFAVAFECLTGTNYLPYYGIWRGKEIPAQARDMRDQALAAQLDAEDFETADGWVGFRPLHDLGLPEFRVTKKEDVLKLNMDNRDPNHPLAHELVSLLWSLFDRHREALEDLNTNYPY